MKLRELRLSARITASALIIVVAGAASLTLIENARIRDTYTSDLRVHLKNDLQTEKLLLTHAVGTLQQDVLFLSNTPPISGIVRAALNRGYDLRNGSTLKEWAERLEEGFIAFSRTHPSYFKIRFIGIADEGREIVRVVNSGGKTEPTPFAELQSKSSRDYFKATLGLQKDQVHLSRFDLTEERGVIEQPIHPTLRATTPVFTPTGEIFGMVVISMDMSSLLNHAEINLPAGAQSYIADETGQYLLHPDPQKTLAAGSRDKITADFPFAETMLGLQAPDYLPLQAVASSNNALISAMRVHFDAGDQSRFLLVLHSIPEAAAAQHIATIPMQHIGAGLIGMLLAGGIAMLVLRRTFSPLEKITAAADKIAAGDHDIMLPKYSSGEIGSLTNALNTMLTQLSQRERLLQEAQSSLLAAQQLAKIGSWKWDVRNDTATWSDETYRIFEIGKSELDEHHKKFLDLVTPEDRIRVDQALNDALAGVKEYNIEYRIRLADGKEKAIHAIAEIIRDPEGGALAMQGTVQDITESKLVNRQLQELSAHLLTVREEEKARVAREIHDDLGGTLAALKIDAYRLSRELSPDKAAAPLVKRVAAMSQLLDSAVSVTRRIISDLRPAILDDLGLSAALEWQAEQFQKRTGISCRVNCVEDKDALDKRYSIALFRIFQEALTNVARHSGASRVEVEYHCHDEEVMLSIIDNGRGLPEEHAVAPTSYGMRSMSERAGQLGGKISFGSPPGGGFSVTVIFHLSDQGNKGKTS